jgi:hypothetical protein
MEPSKQEVDLNSKQFTDLVFIFLAPSTFKLELFSSDFRGDVEIFIGVHRRSFIFHSLQSYLFSPFIEW